MKKLYYPLSVLVLFSIVFWCFPSYYSQSETFQKIGLQTRDIFFKVRHLSSAVPNEVKNVVIVSIDEESCEKLGARWPWSRKIFAEMIDALRMIFSRPYDELYAEAANPASGSSVEDLHAMAAEYIMRLKAATAERIVGRTPAAIVMPTRLPHTGEYFDFVKRRPRFLGN